MNHPSRVAHVPLLRFRLLLPALIGACFATAIFSWNPFGRLPEHAYFEALLRPAVAGEARFLANIDGAGLRNARTISPSMRAGEVNRVHFEIPAGQLYAFAFTPLAAEGEVEVLRCWLSTESGEVAAVLSPAMLAGASPGVRQLSRGGVRVPGMVGTAATVLHFKPTPLIDLTTMPPRPLWQLLLVFAGSLLAVVGFNRLVNRPRWRTLAASALARTRGQPRLAILAVAVVSVAVSCFPVIFCGKSFVSPDNGVQLLYESFPAVPGAQGGRMENPVGSDLGAMFYWHMPASMIQHRAIFDHGEFPLWNRYNWGGVSLWAQCISMLGDPLHWPVVFTGGSAWAWDFKFLAAKLAFAFGVGLLVWSSSRSLAAALLLALSAPWMGFFAYRFCHAGFFALCYAPWVLLPWLEAARAPNLRRVALWAGVLMFANWWQLNSGTAKESSAFLLFLNAAGALALLGAALPWRQRRVRLGVFAWANVLFVLLSAPLWLTFLDALGKAATFYDSPQVCQLQPGLLVGLFDDIFYRQFVPREFLANPSANFFVLLGVAWALVRGRSLARDGTFLAALAGSVGAAAIAFGVVSPHVLARVPMLKNIHHFDNTFSCVLFILLFVLAGYGLRECHRRMRSPEWRGDWVAVLIVVGVVLAGFFGMTHAAHRVGTTFLAIGQTIPKSEFFRFYSGALVLALIILPWAWREIRLGGAPLGAWLLVAGASWTTLHFRHGMYLETRFDHYTMNPKQRLDLRALPSPAVRQIKAAMREPARVVGLDHLMTPGFNTVLGLETISGPDALENPAMRELTAALAIPQVWYWRLVIPRKEFATHRRALDLFGVRYYLANPGHGAALPGTKLLGSSDLDVVESETAWPRAYFTDAVGTYAGLPALRGLVDEGDGRPFAVMIAEARARLPETGNVLATRTVVPATGYRLTQNSTTFDIDAPAPGLAVLGEAWLPDDLQVSVNGRSAEVLRVNHAFRGVFLDQPGRHTVQFRYWPAVMERALWLGGTGALLTLLTIWGVFYRPKSMASAVP
ncbi:MAG TPA: hypothetical protein VGO90_08520 [Chthoniobacteraceae bacterium]|jgi:hypothetical protein|nr:hypothetical protein [Chthoniobacteraceae bacterium]